MRLVHPKIETFFRDDAINVLAVEDVCLFRELCADLYDAVNSGGDVFVLSSETGESVNLSKNGIIISDPFGININERKVLNKLYSEVSQIADEKFALDVAEINDKIASLMRKLDSESSVPLDYADVSPISALLKAFEVSVKDSFESIAERIMSYLSAAVCLCGITCVFFINIKSFLNIRELAELYKFLRYHGVFVFLLESSVRDKCDGEFTVIIDKDLCEIIA